MTTITEQRCREVLAEKMNASRDVKNISADMYLNAAFEPYVAAMQAIAAEAQGAERERLFNCETSLAIYDEGGDSEYWLRYPVRAALSPIPGKGA